ncbi:DUF5723 family protein [Wenyingzhuangia marina]|uniref:DUF5723 domain-containing protein n=1 Tax=Wenyingzhuangia marina TaxID=1195760 RepID=A0A1M5SVH3_9FLAO|nr:DUF5723 family protein [Wenyingzhuangia marina]GGF63987.1 hypothetical protein GCM10011397_03760 [Wenyingzhuangia marina]SHH42003.1 hypothetical protein SAMN05444281_0518 [Wenyingzhuangia marina]
MKNKFVFILVLLYGTTFSQSSIGFIDNYSGIQSVIYNPANILDTPYKLDVNIVSLSGNIGNQYISVNPFKIISDLNFGLNNIKPTYSAFKYNRKLTSRFGIKNLNSYTISSESSSNRNAYGNVTVLGPSFLWTINKYNAVAFTSSIKAYGHAFKLNSILYNNVTNKSYSNVSINSIEELQTLKDNLGITPRNYSQVFSWFEAGFSYAGVISHTASNFLKFGTTLKLLRGIRTGAIYSSDLNLDFQFNQNDPQNSTLDFTGNITNLYSRVGANFGMGLDIGFVYEKRDKTFPINLRDRYGNIYFAKAPYSYKIGVSITNLGFLKYNNVHTNFDQPNQINIDLTSQNYSFRIKDYLAINNLETNTKRYFLPSTASVNFDYHLYRRWFLNTNFDVFMLAYDHNKNIKYVSNLVVSPRYESRHFSAFLPMSINKFGVFTAGIGFRTGYFFAGSSSIFTNVSNYSKAGNFFLGFKIPIYNKKAIKEYKNSLNHKLISPPKLKSRR